MKQMLPSREEFAAKLRSKRDLLIDLCVKLVQTGSENPPGDTTAIAAVIEDVLSAVEGVEVQRIVAKEPVTNLVARVPCGAPGRRLIFNGHLDTFPIGAIDKWTVPPLSGTVVDGRIYGRGASDMKAGLAAATVAAILLAEERDRLHGELVLTFVGDEETGGRWGTGHLLANVPIASGDAMISGDAGSPQVIRFGEKGQIWIELTAKGVANHGAHVHLGVNAIDALLRGIEKICTLRDLPCPIPDDIRAAMLEARAISESVSGEGELDTLQRVTVNLGVIGGGTSVNIIADQAHALLDIRIPPGISAAETIKRIEEMIEETPNVEVHVLTSTDPNVTDPNHEIVELALANAKGLLGDTVVRNMRVGMSDARLYRKHGIPSIVYGPTSYNMGGPDEHVKIDDLFAVFYVQAMTAYDYLSSA
jgi:acetylornithine deacetylase/succinyl-diaminopimelate desuccinylase family protein